MDTNIAHYASIQAIERGEAAQPRLNPVRQRWCEIADLVPTIIATNAWWYYLNTIGIGDLPDPLPAEFPLSYGLSIGDLRIGSVILLLPILDYLLSDYLRAMRMGQATPIPKDFNPDLMIELCGSPVYPTRVLRNFMALSLGLKYYAGAVGWTMMGIVASLIGKHQNPGMRLFTQALLTALGNALCIAGIGKSLSRIETLLWFPDRIRITLISMEFTACARKPVTQLTPTKEVTLRRFSARENYGDPQSTQFKLESRLIGRIEKVAEPIGPNLH